jgi:hypothetical protein
MEIPTFVLVVIWFTVACIGVLFGVAAMALPSMLSWFRRARHLAKVERHHSIPSSVVKRMDREALILQGETIYLAD